MTNRPTRIVKDADGNDVEVPLLPAFKVNSRDVFPALNILDEAALKISKLDFAQEEFLVILAIFLGSHTYTQDRVAAPKGEQSSNPVLRMISNVMGDIYSATDSGEMGVNMILDAEESDISRTLN